MNQRSDQPGLFIGIDRADQKHDCYVIERDRQRIPSGDYALARRHRYLDQRNVETCSREAGRNYA